MINLTDSAKRSLDHYLQQLHTSLRGAKSVDAAEVEQNVMEHIESELADVPHAIDPTTLDAVLKKLGSPQQWLPEDEKLDNARLAHLRVLTYISFGLMAPFLLSWMPHALGALLWRPILETLISFPGSLLLSSFILARVALARVWAPKDLGWQRWLAYPSLILVYVVVLWRILLLPAFVTCLFWLPRYKSYLTELTAAEEVKGYDAFFVLTMITASVGLWWIALGTILWRRPGLLHVIFKPFADWFNSKWAAIFLFIGLALAIYALATYVWSP
ncbi:MAG: hypothetical protein ACYTBJ_04695 [Planctomycetota bacterium]|jgi:hypothetical protein